jgi:hypothetical protein
MTIGAPADLAACSNVVVDVARKSQFVDVMVQLDEPGAPCAPRSDGAFDESWSCPAPMPAPPEYTIALARYPDRTYHM